MFKTLVLALALAAHPYMMQSQGSLALTVSGPVQAQIVAGAVAPAAKALRTTKLMLALKTAKPGDTIVVEPGAYSGIAIQDLSFDRPVTLLAAGAVFDGLQINKVKGLNVVGLEIAFTPENPSTAFQVWSSERLRFSDLKVHGVTTRNGMLIKDSANVLVEGSSFYDVLNGITHSGCSDMVFRNNIFRGMGSDGITGVGTSRILIQGNNFSEFKPVPGAHSDAIQFFTRGARQPVRDITIVGNVMVRGNGGIPQGIFMSEESEGATPYTHVQIKNNYIEGALYNGIGLAHVEDLQLSGNTVQPIDGQQSWIMLYRSKRATVSNNRYWRLHVREGEDVTVSDKATLQAISPKTAASLAKKRSAPPPQQ